MSPDGRRASGPGQGVMQTPLSVLYEDNHCLAVAKPAGVVSTHFTGREETLGRAEVVGPRMPGARQALLHYRSLSAQAGLTWLELRPRTGRTHQLRVQLAHRGHPVYGDAKYGSGHPFGRGIALHARSLTFRAM